ncbi:MAG: hypothetical protein D8M52_05410 [Chlorobi bacterium]|nr:hypothetical protein [Ignavibacteriota bacterium]MBL1161139.1 hypothetical protein [Chlorobiota bacterium]NOG67608.1 hypothetical protein [Chlorobiota bacterium]
MKIIEEMYFLFFANARKTIFANAQMAHLVFPTHKPEVKNQKSHFFANALLKIKVDKIWKLKKQYLLLTKIVNQDSKWKQ